ncbi:CapA family protein [Bacillus cereus group sp. MYBK30-1]|uniref:CapA family protein n=1 Tax=unclassified Bacillus cereus group TaxID=2750818 RepID=UPI003F7B0695
MNILVAGDLVPTQSNKDIFSKGDVTTLLGEELLSIWRAADMRVLNLEVPLTDNESPISKCGPNLSAPTNTINGIKKLEPTLLTLANNHILDHGVTGLKSTEQVLSMNGIAFTGVGENVFEASKPYILANGDINIGVYACAENEFTIATDKSPGANPFDPLESLDHIKELKEKCDYVIVLYHGGREHYRYPSPYLQKVCRKIVEKGADVVICQHSHCIGCYEDYQDSLIVYGQGNFIFDESNNEFWQTSILVHLEITDKIKVDYIPIVKKENVVRLAQGKDFEDILNDFHKRSKEICQEGFVGQQYQKIAAEKYENYLRTFSGMGKWLARIDYRLLNGLILKRWYSKRHLLAIQNFVECEAHRELLLKSLKGENESGR